MRTFGGIRPRRPRRARRIGRRFAGLGLAAALALAAPAPGPGQETPETFRYRMEVMAPGASEPAIWHVFQGPDGVSLVPPSQPPHPLNAWAIIRGEGEDGPQIVRSEEERLLPVWEPEEEYRSGMTTDARDAIMELRDLTWEIIRGASDRRVAGRPTEHYVLTATMKVVAHPSEGLEGLGADSALVSARTDLWIDRGLRFSWAPFAAWGTRALSLGYSPADAHLRKEALPRLRELGLPLRIQTRLTHREYGDPDFSFGQDARTELVVTDLQPADPPAVASRFLEYARSSESQ